MRSAFKGLVKTGYSDRLTEGACARHMRTCWQWTVTEWEGRPSRNSEQSRRLKLWHSDRDENESLRRALPRLVTPGEAVHTGFDLPACRPRARRAADAFFIQVSSPTQGVPMNLTISGHHLDVTPALREYVLTKLDRVTRHFDQVVDINVLLCVEKLKEKERRQRAEVTLHVKGRDIFVENAHEDLYAAIDQLMDKLDRQVVRHKDKLNDHHHVAAKRIDETPA
jgi:putative sigma-54 modulation protein